SSSSDYNDNSTHIIHSLPLHDALPIWQHVVKTGVSIDFLNYKVIKQNGVIPRFVYEQFAPNPTVGTDSFKIPDRVEFRAGNPNLDRKSTRLNSSHQIISYAVFCLKKTK